MTVLFFCTEIFALNCVYDHHVNLKEYLHISRLLNYDDNVILGLLQEVSARFHVLLAKKGFSGRIMIDGEKGELSLLIAPGNTAKAVKDTR